MDDIDDIATRIAGIILSPDTITGLLKGALTVPVDLGYMVYGVFDTGSRFRHETARIRMANAIKHDILNYAHIYSAIEIIFTEFNKYVSETEQDAVYRGVVTSIVGRFGTNLIISKTAAAILERVSFIAASSSYTTIASLSTVFLVAGMTERSIRTSEVLEGQSPKIYNLLRPQDYDLLYFFFKPSAQPFVDAIHTRVTYGEPTFRKIMESVKRKINA